MKALLIIGVTLGIFAILLWIISMWRGVWKIARAWFKRTSEFWCVLGVFAIMFCVVALLSGLTIGIFYGVTATAQTWKNANSVTNLAAQFKAYETSKQNSYSR